MRIFFIASFVLVLSCQQAKAAEAIQKISHRIATNEQVSENMVKDAIESGLWNTKKTAVALTIRKAAGTLCFVLIRQSQNRFMTVDVRNVESSNFGKLGSPRMHYDRYETAPTKWLERDDSNYQVVFRTHAWKDGQRFTVKEPLIIKSDGTPLWR